MHLASAAHLINDEASEEDSEEMEAYEKDDFIDDVDDDVEVIVISHDTDDDDDDEDYRISLNRECGVKRALSFSGERQGKRRRRF